MKKLWEQFDRIVIFDTETTGIEFGQDRIIELGAVSLERGEEVACMDDLILLLGKGSCNGGAAFFIHNIEAAVRSEII